MMPLISPKLLSESLAATSCLCTSAGWILSARSTGGCLPEYMEELSYIDEYLTPLIRFVKEQKNYLIIITSDHGGHKKIHGSQHPDDFRLPFVIHSDRMKFGSIQNSKYFVTDLKAIVNRVLK